MSKELYKLAKTIINDCLGVKEGEVILINGGLHTFKFIEELSIAVLEIGAFPEIRVSTDTLALRMHKEIPDEFLARVPEYKLKWLDDIKACIFIDEIVDPLVFSKIPEEKIALFRKANEPIRDKLFFDNKRTLAIAYPTKAKSRYYNIDYREFKKFLWDALKVDYKEFHRLGNIIKPILDKGEEVFITSTLGTELTFSIKGRTAFIDDGIITPEDLKAGFGMGNLPAGEVFIPPCEDTLCGVAVFDNVFYKGIHLGHLTIYFKNGRAIKIKAEKNEKEFIEFFENADGDKDKIGEWGIGLNPKVTKAIGYVNTDEKIKGSIHLALGENRFIGGKNKSSIHFDMVIMHPTITIDGNLFMDKGKLVF